MFIAHLPAGYLAADLIASIKDQDRRGLIAVGLIASILPDTDLLWFYLVDNRQTAHHEYVFHWPLFWISIAFVVWAISWITDQRWIRPYILMALIGSLLHMMLDSFAAEIYWLRPFSEFHLNAVKVPARFEWWVWNFILHWTFAVELAICATAILVYRRRKAGFGAR